MSFSATKRAWELEFPKYFHLRTRKVRGATCKYVFLWLADHANDEGNAWGTIQTIARVTGLDRKSVIDAIDILLSARLMKHTGLFKGRTGRTPVYRLNLNGSENGTIPNGLIVPLTEPNGPENGTFNGPENGTQNLSSNLSITGGAASIAVGAPVHKENSAAKKAIAELKQMGYLRGKS